MTTSTTPESTSSTKVVPDPPQPQRQSGRWWIQKLVTAALLLGVGVLLIAAIGLAQRVGWISSGSGTVVSGDAASQIYTCAMHPQIRQPGPGDCPICGMALVPATSGDAANVDELAVNIEPSARRLANIQTAEVTKEPIVTSIETIGAIAIDESRMSAIPSYIDGRIEELFADYTGVKVAQGDHLAVVYSPGLYSAQVEYLESRKSLNESRPSSLESVRKAQQTLAENSRQRLVELGVSEEQIAELDRTGEAKSRLTIFSPVSGTVTEKMAMEGKYVKAGEPIYRIADLSTVWLMLELYPEDASRIRFGQRVEAELQSLPGRKFEGRVAFIDPTVNSKDRTVGVRVEFLNEDGRLRPGDYATAQIYLPIGEQGEVYDADLADRWISPMHPQIIRDESGQCPICGMDLVPTSKYGYTDKPVDQTASMSVPRSAVLMAGSNSVVYVETEPGRFEIRPVSLGPILKDRVVILSGVKPGEAVATAGNFLIDSQMQLAGKPSLIDPTRAIVARQERKEPMDFEHVHVEQVAGETGQRLEQLYDVYFAIQKSLAADQKPAEKDAMTLHQQAKALADAEEFSEPVQQQLKVIAEKSEHLHHLPIEKARLEAFRPISHAIVELASLVRSEDATESFSHVFCPMVQGGGGDWLQSTAAVRNPYLGNPMRACGEIVRTFPIEGHIGNGTEDEHQHPADKE